MPSSAFRRACLRGDRPVGNPDDTRLAVQFKEDFDVTLIIHLANGLQHDNKNLACLDFDHDLVAGGHAVKKTCVGSADTGPYLRCMAASSAKILGYMR